LHVLHIPALDQLRITVIVTAMSVLSNIASVF